MVEHTLDKRPTKVHLLPPLPTSGHSTMVVRLSYKQRAPDQRVMQVRVLLPRPSLVRDGVTGNTLRFERRDLKVRLLLPQLAERNSTSRVPARQAGSWRCKSVRSDQAHPNQSRTVEKLR